MPILCVKMCQYRVKVCQYSVNLFQYSVNLCQYRVKLCHNAQKLSIKTVVKFLIPICAKLCHKRAKRLKCVWFSTGWIRCGTILTHIVILAHFGTKFISTGEENSKHEGTTPSETPKQKKSKGGEGRRKVPASTMTIRSQVKDLDWTTIVKRGMHKKTERSQNNCKKKTLQALITTGLRLARPDGFKIKKYLNLHTPTSYELSKR